MALFYHTAPKLDDLFEPLYRQVHTEREKLRPQTPQTIIVGNLDTEAWLQKKFLEADQILMSVNFPFLEAAIGNFILRLAEKLEPSASESWFSAPAATAAKTIFAGMPEIEIILLRMLGDKTQEKSFTNLGFSIHELSPLQRLALARNLAGTLREHLLHAPRAMQLLREKKTTGKSAPLAALWQALAAELEKRNLTSPLLKPEFAEKLIAAQKNNPEQAALYLFGMPLLSAYHIQLLTAIATFCDVHFYGFAPPGGSTFAQNFIAPVQLRYERYQKTLAAEATAQKVRFVAQHVPSLAAAPILPHVELWGLPGKWRAAEILADHWHRLLAEDPQLRQEDIAVALSDAEGQLAAFELAGNKRELSIYTKHKTMQKPQPFVELVRIFSEAALGGLNRAQLIDYLENAAVRRAYNLTPELVQLFAGAFEIAHAYRDDYPESQAEFNFDAALRRIFRGSLIDGRGQILTGVPGHAVIPEFDSQETADLFARCTNFLLNGSRRLAGTRGQELTATLRALFADGPFSGDESLRQVLELLSRLSVAGEPEELTAPQLTAYLREYAPGMGLLHSQPNEGISLSPLSAASFVKPHLCIFDVNEDLEARENDPIGQLPEYAVSATRLGADEQLKIIFASALMSGCRELLLAFSLTEPATGADKYPARQIEELLSALAAAQLPVIRRSDFSQTVIQKDGAEDPPLSSAGDAETARRIALNRLSERNGLAPEFSPATALARQLFSLSDLERFLANPAVARLAQLGVVPEEPVDFRREEPGLSVSTGSRLKFCEEYLHSVLNSADATIVPDPLSVVVQKQMSGSGAPDGFDHAKALLIANDNNRRLAETAAAEKNTTRLIEYIFHEKVKSAFAVRETERLERRYLPAVVVDGCTITGRSASLLERHGFPNLFLLDTSVGDYPKRTTLLIRAHLLMSALSLAAPRAELPAAIEIGKYQIGKTAAEQNILQQEYSVVATIPADSIQNAGAYLGSIISAVQQENLFWFDLGALPAKKKLAVFADAEEGEIAALLEDTEAAGFDGAQREFIRRFYDLKVGKESTEFFDRFIRPVAMLDAHAEDAGKTKKKGKKSG